MSAFLLVLSAAAWLPCSRPASAALHPSDPGAPHGWARLPKTARLGRTRRCCRPPAPLRLTGGVGVLGNMFLDPDYLDAYDGKDENCRCLIGCKCEHCWERNQGARVNRNLLPHFIIDNMLDVGAAPPDTLPSWPPPQGPGADVVDVRSPNSTELEDAVFGPPPDAGAEDLSVNESAVPETRRVVLGAGIWTWETDDPETTRIGHWYKIWGRRALHIEGQSRWESDPKARDVDGDGSTSHKGMHAAAEQEGGGAHPVGPVAQGQGLEVGAGENGEKGIVARDAGGDGAAVWTSRAARLGWIFCDSKKTQNGEEAGKGRRKGVKVLDTVLRGGWFLAAESAGSFLHVVCHKDRGGALIVVAGGNWSFVESRFRVRPGESAGDTCM